MLKYLEKTSEHLEKVSSKMTKMIAYKQFFTPSEYSNIMINHLEMSEPIKVIDLAMGECSLLIEAQKKWSTSEFFGNDIDIECCQKVKDQQLKIKCFNKDIFSFNELETILTKVGEVDLCIGNPPFYLVKQNDDTKKILATYHLNSFSKTKTIPAEVIFILQSLRILKNNGVLSLILPDGFFVNKYLEVFRKFLIENYTILNVIELPRNIFEKTDAKTHILTLKNDRPLLKKIKLINQITNHEIYISNTQAIKRMDYSFYKYLNNKKEFKQLNEYDIEFIRGKSRYLLKEFKESHILHTTNFRKGLVFRSRLKKTNQLLKFQDKIAKENDIIFARVGSSCVGKVGLVKSGYFIATDCVFIIRIDNNELRNRVYESLTSEEGQLWIKSHSKGVAARHITLEDIKKFPLFL
ncbi:N-6 DNA methylase [Halarcobacter ebronensis]|uniref:site-specific DNA-methyltransferase (adenine-specific) n=1 Tax=Halarcobacter ebronensis TaxID=1462615 RepID=A0A4Q1ALF2_9BACT|nr:N-6 DNA methylase [Halarcobacter ebronensis]QKF83391.1 type II DNA methyltransferase [Halarcobacter ebronensis]RXK05951.1 hypothetical protein CRV07_07720 [Halarcobacter ebronensis]